jgi:hypothetical protein
MTAIYRKRENLFRSGETEWRAEDDALVRRESDGGETRLNWAEVTALRLRFNPTMAKRWLHEFTVASPRMRMVIDNSHFVAVSEFEDRSADYTPFVRTALSRIEALSPGARIEIGARRFAYWSTIAFAAGAMAMLAAVLFMLPLPAPPPLAIVVKLAIIGYLLSMLPRWLRTNRPRPGDFSSASAELP